MGTSEEIAAARRIASQLEGFADLLRRQAQVIGDYSDGIQGAIGGTSSGDTAVTNIENAESVLVKAAGTFATVAGNLNSYASSVESA